MKRILKPVLDSLDKCEPTLESIQKIILQYFANNVCAEYTENGQTLRVTYKEMFDRASIVASNILSKGRVSKNQVCILKMANSVNWLIAFWGIVQAGIKPILVNPSIEKDVYQSIVKQLTVFLTINDANMHLLLKNTNKRCSVDWAKEVAFLSSGTTDIPKIITYDVASFKSQIMVASWVLQKNKAIRINNKDGIDSIKILAFLPFHHIFGFMVIVIWFGFFGRTMVFLDNLSPEAIQYACKKHQVTHFFAVPLVWENVVSSILNEAKRQGKDKLLQRVIKFSNWLQTIFPTFGTWFARNILFKKVREQALGNTLTFLISGGSMINKSYLKVLNGLGYSIHNGYGLTESGIVCVELSKRTNKRNLESVGIPFPNVTWRNNKGVLEIKGDLLFKTCLSHNKTEVIDKNAWYSTNDAIRVKKNRLIIIGRQDDAIIGSDGNNVYPETIENLYNTTSLYTVGIVGIKQRSGYHRISLLVKFNKTISDDVKQRVIHNILKITEQIPISRRPARFFEVNNIPLTELGKVKHHELTTLYEHNKIELSPISTNSIVRQEQSEKIDPELLKKIRQCFANVFKIKIEEVQNDTNFITDLGGSSLDYYSILNEIQHVTGKEIKLVGEKILLTPNDFAIYLMR